MSTSAIYLLVIILVILRLGKEREINPSRLLLMPVIYVVLIGAGIAQSFQPTAAGLLVYPLCLLAGIGLGIWRGKMEIVRVNPSTGKITSQSSPAGIALFVGAMALRLIVEYWGTGHALVLLSNALLLVPLGSICARRFIVYAKYRQMAAGQYR